MVKKFKSTAELKVSEKIIGQVLGQDEAVKVIKKAAQQRRHVLLIGEPGTGKSMLGLALAELLPKSKLKDIRWTGFVLDIGATLRMRESD